MEVHCCREREQTAKYKGAGEERTSMEKLAGVEAWLTAALRPGSGVEPGV